MSADPNRITRHFVSIENKRQIHFRKAGKGPPVLLLHQSPKSSKELIPVIDGLKKNFTCIAPDTPGNGNSDPLQEKNPTMIDYGKNIKLFLDELGIDKVCVYGFHTGASVGGSFASQFPERVNVAVLNGFVALNSDERKDIMSNYLTPLTYSWDGSHLLWSWARLREQHIFFPWYKISDETRMQSNLPEANQIHENLMEFFRSGDEYRKPYGAAFMFEGDKVAKSFQSPTIICASDWDPTVRFIPRLPEKLPDCVQIKRLGDKRGSEVTEWLESIFVKYASGDSPEFKAPKPLPNRFWQDFIDLNGIQLHVRRSNGNSRPVILQHEIGDDNNCLSRLTNSEINAIAFDMPCHGESDNFNLDKTYNLETVSDCLSSAIKKIGIDDFDFISIQNSSAISINICESLLNKVNKLYLVNFQYISNSEKKEFYDKFSFEINPSRYGEHLIKCWNFLRDQSLFYPWYNNKKENLILNQSNLDINYLHERVISLLKAENSWHKMCRMLANVDENSLLDSSKVNIGFAGNKSHPHYRFKAKLMQDKGDSKWTELNDSPLSLIKQILG